MIYRDYLKIQTGYLVIEVNDESLVRIFFTKTLDKKRSSNRASRKVIYQLKQFFSGKREEFDLDIKLVGTDFQKKVWSQLIKIPFGETSSYGDIAKQIGRPKAARAVGGACNKNPILVVVPCHRVVGSTGNLTGFACGLDVKRELLQIEASP